MNLNYNNIIDTKLFNEFKHNYSKENWEEIKQKHNTIINILANQTYLKPEDYLVQRTIEQYIDLINNHFYTINRSMIMRLATSIQHDNDLKLELSNISMDLHELLYQALIIFALNYKN